MGLGMAPESGWTVRDTVSCVVERGQFLTRRATFKYQAGYCSVDLNSVKYSPYQRCVISSTVKIDVVGSSETWLQCHSTRCYSVIVHGVTVS